MDPIHPIVPHAPTIAPVERSPEVGRINRERRRPQKDDRRAHDTGEHDNGEQDGEAPDDARADGDGPHIDVTA